MPRHDERAKELFLQGYNCAQAVFTAFAEETGMPVDRALKLASSFGGGMGGMREVCGAVSGMLMAAGCLYGYDAPNDPAAKKAHYARVRELAEEFRARNGSVICRELLQNAGQMPKEEPSERTPEYYQKRPCPNVVAAAAAILDEYIESHPIEA